METGFMNRIIGLVLALVVGGLLVGGLLIPSIEGMTATEKTFENKGYYTMDKFGTDTELVITWDDATPNVLNIGDDTLDLSFATIGQSFTIVGGDSLAVRYTKAAGYVMFQGLGESFFSSGSNQDVTITITSGSVICQSTRSDIPDYTVTYTYSDSIYVANPNDVGEYTYVMKESNKPAYINGDSELIFIGLTNVESNKIVGIYGEGTLNDGMTLSTILAQATTVDGYSEPIPTYTAVNGYNDLYALDKYEFTITYDTSSTYDATYSYFIVPASVTAELSQHMTPTEIAMFGVISILGIVALVVVAANGIRNKY